MIVWAVTATITAVVLLVILICYRRQVARNCFELKFLKEHRTNLRMTSGIRFAELEELMDRINDVLDVSEEIRKKAQYSEETLKQTITSLSHDIRTPLTSLDGYFQLLSQSSSEEERMHYINIISGRIASLKDMLEELFTYAKLQNDNYELSLGKTDFSKCVYDSVFSYYDEFKRKNIEPEADFCEERLWINGNPEAVRRILQNILKNALEHGSNHISFCMWKKEEKVYFACSNDVKEPEDIDIARVFDRFYRADRARSETSTGLGLSIAKALSERLGGEISAELAEGRFTVKICFKNEI